MRKAKRKPGKKPEWSKFIVLLVVLLGFIIVQECFLLMWLCIRGGYAGTAAWLTAAVGLAEAVIGAGLSGYLSLCKKDHAEGGITFEAAKSHGFKEDNADSPPI